ncbi:hypothetical protein [Actinomyces wuliandei]|uniref:hypothetical protein n=1 Tax=Actinomyces wuliandei TaxID=2057743 RepID=UPI000FD880E5|nr:hypothetical protein [Actinomyces wuliandei]
MRAGVVLLVCVVVGACSVLPWGGGDGGDVGAVAPASVSVEEAEFGCVGVPTSSFEVVLEEPVTFEQSVRYQDDWGIRYVNCAAYAAEGRSVSPVVIASFGRMYPGKSPVNQASAWQSGQEGEPFGVAGVDGEGEVALDDYDGTTGPGGSAVFVCGDRYVVASVQPGHGMRGDRRANLVNLATSMTPWVCQGEPVPGAGQRFEDLEGEL